MRLSELKIHIQKMHEANKTLLLTDLYAIVVRQIFDDDKACFLATEEYVYALRSNHPLKANLHTFFKHLGREY